MIHHSQKASQARAIHIEPFGTWRKDLFQQFQNGSVLFVRTSTDAQQAVFSESLLLSIGNPIIRAAGIRTSGCRYPAKVSTALLIITLQKGHEPYVRTRIYFQLFSIIFQKLEKVVISEEWLPEFSQAFAGTCKASFDSFFCNSESFGNFPDSEFVIDLQEEAFFFLWREGRND